MEKDNSFKRDASDSNKFMDEFLKKYDIEFANKPKSPVEKSTKKGVIKHKKVVTSKGMVVDLHEKGLSQSKIASELGVSQQYVSKVLRQLKCGSDRRERFHNFSLTFNAVFNYWQFPESEYKSVLFGHTQYKNWDNGDFHIQIFVNGRIMVRYNKDVIGLRIVENEAEAIRRILDFLQEWNKYGVRFIDYVISSGENEFMNSSLALGIARKGQTIRYKNRADGKTRSIIDFSKSKSNPSGAPHFEHVHPLHYNSDSQRWEEILDDVATGNYDPLHVTKAKLDSLYGVLDDVKNNALLPLKEQTEALREQLSVHLPVERGARDALVEDAVIRKQQLEVQSETLKTLKSIRSSLDPRGRVSREFVCDDSGCVEVDSSKRAARKAHVRDLLYRFGW